MVEGLHDFGRDVWMRGSIPRRGLVPGRTAVPSVARCCRRNFWNLGVRSLKVLILSRKKDGVIRINDDISIVVVDIRGDKVRLGIVAPPDVTVHRGEVYDAIKLLKANPDLVGGEA
jgi:carbon storage regulator